MNLTAKRTQQIAVLIGRFLTGGVYLWAVVDNLRNMAGATGYAASKGLPNAEVMVPLAQLILLVAAVSILTGLRPVIGVAALATFLVPVTFIMHPFWTLQGVQAIAEMHNFQANVIMLGSGLIFLGIPRPWSFSLDHWLASAAAPRPIRDTAPAA